MIKINLAKKKKAVGTGGQEKGRGGSGLKGINIDSEMLKGLPIRRMAIAFAAVLAGSTYLDEIKAEKLAEVDGRINEINQKLATLRTKVNAANQILSIQKQLEADEFTLKNKLETIQKLMSDRENPPKMMRALSSAMPKDLWLTRYVVEGSGVSLWGYATRFEEISDFIRQLEESAYYNVVELKQSKQKTETQGPTFTEFELAAKRE
ncbi:MAG: PilN domain-containing protein [Bdellovibrionales bacterium]|nr:PilN domain-containing protein [Bdellovibrionales bacterium]